MFLISLFRNFSFRYAHFKFALLLGISPLAFSCSDLHSAEIADFIGKPDDSFSWRLAKTNVVGTTTVYEIGMTSQTWQGTPWEHALKLYLPKRNVAPDGIVLVIAGNHGGEGVDDALYAALAGKSGIAWGFLTDVPNQPLLDGKIEDALIAESFRRFITSTDDTWPLLLPMTKAAVRTMDVISEFSEKFLGNKIGRFIMSGASKRGWTAWLSAAHDSRVVALAPMVIDMLNVKEQIKHQLTTQGTLSEATRDYHALVNAPASSRLAQLWRMIDPYTYRDVLLQPKLMILGSNDLFWCTDSLNVYWNDLKGDKWIYYVPNAGHSLIPGDGSPNVVWPTVAVFAHHVFTGAKFPRLTWNFEQGTGDLTVRSTEVPAEATLWTATATTRDFRQATWKATRLAVNDGVASVAVPKAEKGYSASFFNLTYTVEGISFTLSTSIQERSSDGTP